MICRAQQLQISIVIQRSNKSFKSAIYVWCAHEVCIFLLISACAKRTISEQLYSASCDMSIHPMAIYTEKICLYRETGRFGYLQGSTGRLDSPECPQNCV